MKALVTGASGFLGMRLVAHLRASSVQVRAFVRSGRGGAVDADEICEGDLRDPQALTRAVSGVDQVFHVGARVSTSGPWEEFEAVNVRATERLIRLAAEAGARRIVHVSSLSVYAVPHDGAVVTEESAYDDGATARGRYARSKLAADQIAMEAGRAGVPVVVVRPGLLYGPGRLPPLARRWAALGPLRLIFASRHYRMPLAYVDNVVDALRLAMDVEGVCGRAYTVVDTHVDQEAYTRLYRQASGARWISVYVPLAALRFGAASAERAARLVGARPPVTRHQVERTLRSATFVTIRAERELGWRPRVSLEEALGRTFAAARGVACPATTAMVNSVA